MRTAQRPRSLCILEAASHNDTLNTRSLPLRPLGMRKASTVFEQEAAEVAEEAILQSTCQKGLKFLPHPGLTRTVPSPSSVHPFSAASATSCSKMSQPRIQHAASRTQKASSVFEQEAAEVAEEAILQSTLEEPISFAQLRPARFVVRAPKTSAVIKHISRFRRKRSARLGPLHRSVRSWVS